MSVVFAQAVIAGLRYNGVEVRFPVGDWDRRGNGQTSDYQGLSLHHTASKLGNAYSTLWNGRPDLSGPLCNSAGDADGAISIIAAHPANHAGASGGRGTAPLPVTRTFNRLMWGHEIVYPGVSPMTDAQYRSSCILGSIITGILKRPSPAWVKAHAETSVTGKWDPGYAPNKTYDMNALRTNINAFASGSPGGIDMPLSKADLDAIWRYPVGNKHGNATVWAGDLIAWSDFHSGNGRASVDNIVIPTLARLEAKLAVMGAPDIDEDALARLVIKQLTPIIEAAVMEALGKDNEAQATAILNALGAKLAPGT